jgi:RimJ/RimL family protein N-acetyltransferase
MTHMFNTQPTLIGPLVALRPLVAEDFEALYAAAADPLIWAQHPQPTRWQREVFAEHFFKSALAGGSAFVVLDNASGAIIGSTRYYDWQPQSRSIALGFTFLARAWWGGPANQEMKQLLLEHAWHWVDTVWFHIGAQNLRSRRALEKIGGRFSHVEERSGGGTLVSTALYRIDAPGRRV